MGDRWAAARRAARDKPTISFRLPADLLNVLHLIGAVRGCSVNNLLLEAASFWLQETAGGLKPDANNQEPLPP